ncbi:MAG: ribulokinase [Ruminococcaceae bacterium]|nr:ribulokinase [Oscillospiraceae bacterium]
MKTVIGIDFGTQSARAVLADTENGTILASHTVNYLHGVPEDSLIPVSDYDNALTELMEAVTDNAYAESVAAICVDATALTLVPIGKDGRALGWYPEFADRPNAQIKLWKRHTAQKQANEAIALAKQRQEPFLGRTGGSVSSEWTLPKLLETRDEDPEVYAAMDLAMDLCEYLTYLLTGEKTRSIGSMSYKGLWAEDLGFPSDGFLNGLREGFAEEYKHLMRGEVKRTGEAAGTLKKELSRRFGLREDVIVASGTLDGHTALVSLGAMKEGEAALVIGTSNVLAVQTESVRDVEGICGIAQDGFIQGVCSIDSGQNCTGEMLGWFMENMLPAAAAEEAKQKGISSHDLLIQKVKEPWNNRAVAVDMWNGSRNAPCDLELRGMFAGMSLETKPEDVYLALLQAIACGTREIMEWCERDGIRVERLAATGGIALKNPLLMQQYSDILNLPVDVGVVKEGPALGSAMFAAVAAGIYSSPIEAYEHMGNTKFIRYTPDEQHRAEYEEIYRRNHLLREAAKLFK